MRTCALGFRALALSQAYARPSAVVLNKFDAGCLNCGSNLVAGTFPPSKFTVDGLEPGNCGFGHARPPCQDCLGPSKQSARRLNLPCCYQCSRVRFDRISIDSAL